jgi:DNA mismatch repair protein MutS2
MNTHALRILELDRVLAHIAERAATALGAAHVRALAPIEARETIEREHGRVAAVGAFIAGETGWTPEPIPDLRGALARLRAVGSSWTGTDLRDGALLLRSGRRTADALRDQRRPAMARAALAPFTERMVTDIALEREVDRAITDDGGVADDASPELRRELRFASGALVHLLERIMARLDAHQQVPDMSVTVRNGRYVIPIRREARTAIGGIVHDASATGATLFVEPPAAVEAANHIREMEAEEQHEVERILLALTDRFRPLHAGLVAALAALTELDSLYARARFAQDMHCAPMTLSEPADGFDIRTGRHPLLEAQGIAVVPFDLTMKRGERTLLISGPNTGGKTVLLKALGLLSAMVQSGVPATVGPESRIPLYDDIFADVGDEQSIQASLSTFSAHVANISEILRSATSESLVLMDEIGSGTDPIEGAALAGAVLEALTTRGAMTVATTHLGVLQQLATEHPGVINASLQFDAVALAPTYHLTKGIPGRSYGLSIARRLGLPDAVLARAEERLPSGERDVAALLAGLEERDRELGARERTVATDLESARQRGQRVADRERAVTDRERAVERESRRDARRYVLDARKEIERTVRELKAAGAAQLEESARAARQTAERLAAEHGEALERVEREEVAAATETAATAAAVEAGDIVEVITFGGRAARVLDIRDDEAVVAMGAMKMNVPVASLRRSRTRLEADSAMVPLRGEIDDSLPPSEIDLRGLRADELDAALLLAIDAAARADLRTLRIIHGKGTGALRARVAEMLHKDTRVASFRIGAWNEGGGGVTVVELS